MAPASAGVTDNTCGYGGPRSPAHGNLITAHHPWTGEPGSRPTPA